MKQTALFLSLAFFAATSALFAQSAATTNTGTSSSFVAAEPAAGGGAGQAEPATTPTESRKKVEVPHRPFSEFALGAGISTMGVNLQAATNVNRYLNLRGSGNIFPYTANNIDINGSSGDGSISSNGLNVNGQINFDTAAVSLDYYPFPRHGFRLSPGALLYNQNGISATGTSASGASFTLNGVKYYSASANTLTGATPISVVANLGLNAHKQAFTMTTGWGNMIPRMGGHWAFPVEIGAAFTGTPTLKVNLTGWACLDQAQTLCSDVGSTTNPIGQAVQSNLAAQVAKWKSDLDPLKVYPILSFGVSYAFHSK